ncbi:hypothetical protein [Sediminivirga luteola]|uniref:hypothetical protein n=1 Tax=Sediminivirga luteola TaxID=1774748 RepID=UPI001F58FE1E|nr:hypothetical protein [Sediminivirga luteola]MCI2266893.1 hypothetical protein [Sediminivirga luteola]
MSSSPTVLSSAATTGGHAVRALRLWGPRQIGIALGSGLVIAVLIGIATVLIPNSLFARDIPTVWWNYPVWVLTSLFSGMLIATYVRPGEAAGSTAEAAEGKRESRLGMVGAVLAWFAVGCPVCNKIALLALGYTGALTWFAPLQPVLAVAALVLTGGALVVRLRGQVSCPVKARTA